MIEPKFVITADSVQRYAEMFDLGLPQGEAAPLAGQLAGGFGGIAALWDVDVSGAEPSVILPVDRW